VLKKPQELKKKAQCSWGLPVGEWWKQINKYYLNIQKEIHKYEALTLKYWRKERDKVILNLILKQELHSLVGRFKFFSRIYGEKCCLFFRHFSLKKVVKNSKHFHYFVSLR
jgi:hypothetical protein